MMNDGVLDEGSSNVTIKIARGQPAERAPPLTVNCDRVTYRIGKQTVLDGVCAKFRPGDFTAVMGPSGAGKTTLLNVIVPSNAKGRQSGRVTYNGRTSDELQGRLRRRFAYIPQEDVLVASQTPREALTYAGRLRLPSVVCGTDIPTLVNDVLTQLGLQGCADRRIGDVSCRGISGGERRRVSIALELLTRPSLLLFDEPTSGLDSKTAEDVLAVLRRLARDDGLNVICCVHQPSAEAFAGFTNVLILFKGRTVFHGPPAKAQAHFSRVLGLHVPEGANPADVIMRDLKSPGLDSGVLALAKGEEKDEDEVEVTGRQVAHDEPDLLLLEREQPVGAFRQTLVLLERQLADAVKDRTKFVGGFLLKVGVGVLIGLVWLNQWDTTQESRFIVSSALFVSLVLWIIDTVFRTITSFPCSRPLLIREYRNGWYGLLPVYTATLGAHLLMNAMYAAVASVPIFLLIGFPLHAQRLLGFIGVNVLLTIVGATLGLSFGCICSDFAAAQQLVMPTIVPNLLFSGFLIPYSRLNPVFRLLYMASPFSHALNLLQMVVYSGVRFTDCQPRAAQALGLACFSTGEAYLDSIHASIGDLWVNLGVLMGVEALLCVAGLACMRSLLGAKTY